MRLQPACFACFFHLHVTLVGCVQIPDNPNRFKSSTIKFIHGMRTNRPYLMIQLYINFHWKELPEAAPWGRESLVGKQEKQEKQETNMCFHMENRKTKENMCFYRCSSVVPFSPVKTQLVFPDFPVFPVFLLSFRSPTAAAPPCMS